MFSQVNVMSKYEKYVTISDTSNKDFTVYSILNIKDDGDGFPYNKGNKLASYSYIQEKFKSLTGKVLTIIDASMPEGKQSKCVKDLIRKEFVGMFQETADDLLDMSGYPTLPDNVSELPQTMSNKEILGA